ncbi:MAG: restriction endonuclease subunit S [Bacteroidales bacterium]|nr:restriction endonuclease subunit S [Bacteroidales bacterium]MDY4175599.1 restriction endonuclease subunit S [Bacteroidales bacterium]
MKVDKTKWEKKTLGEICSIKRGASPRPIKKFITDAQEGVNWIKIGDTGESKYISSCKERIIPEGVSKSRFVRKGDLLLSNSMSFGHPYILNVDGCIHDGWLVLEKPTSFDTNFMYYLLSSDKTYKEFSKRAKGAVVNNLNIELVSSVLVSYPPLSEQSAIASELDNLQTVIDGYKAQLADLDALAQSVFLEMFGDPVGNPKGWECYRLDSICKTTAGGTPSKSKTENYSNGTINWLRSGEVNKHYIISTELKISNIGLNNSSAKVLPPNTVVVAMYGATAGQVGILKIESSTNQAVCGILPSSSISHEYLYFTILLLNTEIVKQAEGVAQPNISQGIIKALNIPLPPLPLQNQFASRVEAIEKQKEQIRQQLKDAETLMAERMQYYFG